MYFPYIIRPGLKNRDTYHDLLYEVGIWSPLQDPRPDGLYAACKDLIQKIRNGRLADYAIVLKHYLLLKAGRAYRLSKGEYRGDLQRLVEDDRNTLSAAARWILARSYASEIAFTDSPHEQYSLLESAARLIAPIKHPVSYKLPILLPGIRSEIGADKLKGDILGQADPKVTILPVPYRYFTTYLVNQADPAFKCPPDRNLALLDLANTYCTHSKREHGSDHPFLSTNIDISANVIDTLRIYQGNKEINRTVVIDQFGRLIQRIGHDIGNHLLSGTKGLEWLATCHAGLAILSTGDKSNRLQHIQQLHTLAAEVAHNRQGHVDFFMIDVIYRLAQPDLDEAKAFRECIRYQPPSAAPEATTHEKETINIYKINTTIMGDIIHTGDHSPVIKESTVSGSFNANTQQASELAQALTLLATLIERTGNPAATQQFQQFAEEAKKEKPDRSLLKSAWEGLTKLLPILSTMSDIADKITKLWHP